jgi:hypothetical protein
MRARELQRADGAGRSAPVVPLQTVPFIFTSSSRRSRGSRPGVLADDEKRSYTRILQLVGRMGSTG